MPTMGRARSILTYRKRKFCGILLPCSQFPFVFPKYKLGQANVDLFIRGHKERLPSLANEKEQGVFQPCSDRRICVTAFIQAMLLLANPPNAKMQQINTAAITNLMIVPTLVSDL